jgi:putative hemolysin
MSENPVILVFAVAAMAVAFLLSGMEAGVLALSRFRIRRLARAGDRRAARLQEYLEHPESFLWTILVGNTLATLATVTAVTLHLADWYESRPLVLMTLIGGLLLFLHVFADLLPKLLFRRFPNRLCLIGVVPFRLLRAVLEPLVGLTEWVSRRLLRLTRGQAFTGRLFGNRAEFRHVIEESAQSLSREELVMINRILDLQNLRVRDVMTPIDRAVTCDTGTTIDAFLTRMRERAVSYTPVWNPHATPRRILGVVPINAVLLSEAPDGSRPLSSLVQPALFVDDSTRLEDALRLMQRSRQRLAVVLNAKRIEIGVITLSDILTAMFGEVRV